MKDFIVAALPFVVMGICLAIFFANRKKIKEKTFMPFGMCIGLAIGISIGTAEGHTGLGATTGMLVGMVIGLLVKDNGEESEDKEDES